MLPNPNKPIHLHASIAISIQQLHKIKVVLTNPTQPSPAKMKGRTYPDGHAWLQRERRSYQTWSESWGPQSYTTSAKTWRAPSDCAPRRCKARFLRYRSEGTWHQKPMVKKTHSCSSCCCCCCYHLLPCLASPPVASAHQGPQIQPSRKLIGGSWNAEAEPWTPSLYSNSQTERKRGFFTLVCFSLPYPNLKNLYFSTQIDEKRSKGETCLYS